MTNPTAPTTRTKYDYQGATNIILGQLRRERDRQIIAGRFGFGMAKRQTLEKIGNDFNITRERVRQIEKAAVTKLRSLDFAELSRANEVIFEIVRSQGGVALVTDITLLFSAFSRAASI
jgi:DNA-directed RNA polymerase sigma subunit (sigma70/sigma32)